MLSEWTPIFFCCIHGLNPSRMLRGQVYPHAEQQAVEPSTGLRNEPYLEPNENISSLEPMNYLPKR